MGAETFMVTAEGATAAEAFAAAVDQARHEHGHAGGTGTIAEKDSFTSVAGPELSGDPEAVCAYLRYCDSGTGELSPAGKAARELFDDKWAPAGHVDLGGGRHLFFGSAPS